MEAVLKRQSMTKKERVCFKCFQLYIMLIFREALYSEKQHSHQLLIVLIQR